MLIATAAVLTTMRVKWKSGMIEGISWQHHGVAEVNNPRVYLANGLLMYDIIVFLCKHRIQQNKTPFSLKGGATKWSSYFYSCTWRLCSHLSQSHLSISYYYLAQNYPVAFYNPQNKIQNQSQGIQSSISKSTGGAKTKDTAFYMTWLPFTSPLFPFPFPILLTLSSSVITTVVFFLILKYLFPTSSPTFLLVSQPEMFFAWFSFHLVFSSKLPSQRGLYNPTTKIASGAPGWSVS